MEWMHIFDQTYNIIASISRTTYLFTSLQIIGVKLQVSATEHGASKQQNIFGTSEELYWAE